MRSRLRVGAALGVTALVAGFLVTVAPVLAPATAVAGVPNAPTVIYSEDFENAPDSGNPLLLTNYVSASPQYSGGRYDAAAFWASYAKCNGFVVSTGNSYPPKACDSNENNFAALKYLSQTLGTIGGTNPNTNSAVAAYTAGSDGPTSNLVEFSTVTSVGIPPNGRYLTFSVDAVARNCGSNQAHPNLQFYQRSASGVETKIGDNFIDPCDASDPRRGSYANGVFGGRYPASGSFLSTSSSVGIMMRNLSSKVVGNDGAFDNIQLLDATPSLDKSFGTPNPVTGVSRLTLTLTNTTELATKLGWQAVDSFASGLVVASPSNSATTCTSGKVTAIAGGNSVKIEGDLSGDTAHLTSCTFTIDVVPAQLTAQGAPAQVYQNCASNITQSTGVIAPSVCASGAFAPVAALDISKTSTATADTREGDAISYQVKATNTGGSDYTVAEPAKVVDDMTAVLDDATYNTDAVATLPGTPTFASPKLSWAGALKVGQSVTITYSMTATLAGDGILSNEACVPAGQASGQACATSTTTVVIAPAIDLVKSASPSDAASFKTDQVIDYRFVVTNTGNLVLNNPKVNEIAFQGQGVHPIISCPPTPTLAPGAQMTCSVSYKLVQADINGHSLANPMKNTAQASATDSNGAPVSSAERTVFLPSDPQAALTIVKDTEPGTFTARGEAVIYTFLITNTGNVTLTDAGVQEGTFSGTGLLGAPVCAASAASLIPGAQTTCTATYALTQDDVDAGHVSNDATAFATPPDHIPFSSPSDDAVVTIDSAPAIAITKSASPGPYTKVGDVVEYTFDVINNGNVTLGAIGITEGPFSGTGTLSTPVCSPLTLRPGVTSQCTATYSLTQSDVDSGTLSNSAIAQGTPPTGSPVTSVPCDALVTIDPVATLSLVKTIDVTTVAGSGQYVTYSFLVTNTGTSTMSGVRIADTWFSGTGPFPSAVCPTHSLAPGASTTCTASYTTTDSDAAVSEVTNTATASAIRPGGAEITSAISSARLAIDPVAAVLAATGAVLFSNAIPSAVGGLLLGIALVAVSVRRRKRPLR